jgi:hypothetical protein
MERFNSVGTSLGSLPFCTQAYQLKDISLFKFWGFDFGDCLNFDLVSCVGCFYDVLSPRLYNLEW